MFERGLFFLMVLRRSRNPLSGLFVPDATPDTIAGAEGTILMWGFCARYSSLEEIVMKSPWYLLVLVLWNVYVGIILYPYLAFH